MIFSKAIEGYRNEGPKSAVGKNIIFFDRTSYWLMLWCAPNLTYRKPKMTELTRLDPDKAIDIAYDIFLEMAPENLDPADILTTGKNKSAYLSARKNTQKSGSGW